MISVVTRLVKKMSTWSRFTPVLVLSGFMYIFFLWRTMKLTDKNQYVNTEKTNNIRIFQNDTGQLEHVMAKKVILDIPALTEANNNKHENVTKIQDAVQEYATVNLNVTSILNKLDDSWKWAFIKKRIQDNWGDRVQAVKEALAKNLLALNRTKRQVLIYPGLILDTSFAKSSFKGGPLGELVQWADLISGLHILGHHVVLMYNSKEVSKRLQANINLTPGQYHPNGCQSGEFHCIYTDLMGHRHFPKFVIDSYRYKFRILDSFGTEQQYNNAKYARRKKISNAWGLRDLHMKQFYTLFGHTRDNSFLGFIIKSHVFNSTHPEKKNISVLYGKDERVLKREELAKVLPILSKYTEVHMTLPRLPAAFKKYNITNHKVLKPQEYGELVHSAKFVVGAGLPMEGPGVIEAIAAGCIFINPKLRDKEKKFAQKPTNRTASSQHSYAEKSIGAPYVYTVNYDNATEVEGAILKALNNPVKPYIPFELTTMGFLLKLNLFLENQDLCGGKPPWPPIDKMKVKVGDQSASCNEVCEAQGLQCENTFFKHLNTETTFKSLSLNCDTTAFVEEIFAPAFVPDKKQCLLQKDPHLFSCASYLGPDPEISRICPCRDYTRFGSHFCKWC